MLRRLLRCLAPVILVLSLSLSNAAGQGEEKIERGVSAEPATTDSDKNTGPSALPYFVMAIYSMLVLTIVFMPSRKA